MGPGAPARLAPLVTANGWFASAGPWRRGGCFATLPDLRLWPGVEPASKLGGLPPVVNETLPVLAGRSPKRARRAAFNRPTDVSTQVQDQISARQRPWPASATGPGDGHPQGRRRLRCPAVGDRAQVVALGLHSQQTAARAIPGRGLRQYGSRRKPISSPAWLSEPWSLTP